MKLKKLNLENFRNHNRQSYDFELDHNLIILEGPNGVGKTNVMEAIYLLSLGKSFRCKSHEDLVQWEKEYLRCTGEVDHPNLEKLHLEVFYAREPNRKRNFKRNGVNLKNTEFLGNLLTVLFHPEDLNMLYLEPSLRRRYLDIVLSQTDKKYLLALSKYKKVLRQRNALLRQIREFHSATLLDDLNVWDAELIEYGCAIIKKRLFYVDFLNQNLENFYNSISDDKDRVSVEYESKILKNTSTATLQTLFTDELALRRKRDIFQAETTAGPHRDDLTFYLNGKNIHSSASRGEFRTLLLALKLAEVEFIKTQTQQNPILLLDDVFSELDKTRQKQLLKSFQGCQVIITTNDAENLGKLSKESRIIGF